MLRRLFIGLFLCLACKSTPSGNVTAALTAQLNPYDFTQKTPENITKLLQKAGDDTSEEAATARYLASRARLDWLLVSWLNQDNILFEKLATHLGLVGCSHLEERDRCLKEIPAKILKDLQDPTVFVPDATALKNLLSALQLGPGNAAQALGVNNASKKNTEIALRARLVVLATAKPTIRHLPNIMRTKALETLAFQAPFLCPDSFLSLDPDKRTSSIEATAAYCGFACPAHRNGVLSVEDTIPTLLEKCSIEYYGFTKGQESFVTKRNFIAFRVLQNMLQHLKAADEATKDPLYPFVEKSLKEIRSQLEALRFFASLELENSSDGLSFTYSAPLYQIDSAPYLVIRGSQLFVALWPTLRASKEEVILAEKQYAHPGKLIGSTQESTKLAQEISDAASFEFSLGQRLPHEKFEETPPTPLPYVAGIPEGTKDRGKPIFLMTNPSTTFQEFFDASIAATDAGFGKIRLLTNLSTLRKETVVEAIEVLFARGEDLALLEKSPLGFPGGALIILVQPTSLRVVLPPGLEKSSLSQKARDGITITDGNLTQEIIAELFQYFTAQRLIIASAPGIKMEHIAKLLDFIKNADDQTEVLFAPAPEVGLLTWAGTLPKATAGNFTPQEPSILLPETMPTP